MSEQLVLPPWTSQHVAVSSLLIEMMPYPLSHCSPRPAKAVHSLPLITVQLVNAMKDNKVSNLWWTCFLEHSAANPV